MPNTAGTATAIATSIATAGLGTDTGDSVRIPSALTDIVVLRPSMDRYSQQGVTPVSTTRDTIGPMAKSVADTALLDAVICAENPALPGIDVQQLRLGVPGWFFIKT